MVRVGREGGGRCRRRRGLGIVRRLCQNPRFADRRAKSGDDETHGGEDVVATMREFSSHLSWNVLRHSFNLVGSHDTSRVATLSKGDVVVTEPEGGTRTFTVDRGFVSVDSDFVTVVADHGSVA